VERRKRSVITLRFLRLACLAEVLTKGDAVQAKSTKNVYPEPAEGPLAWLDFWEII